MIPPWIRLHFHAMFVDFIIFFILIEGFLSAVHFIFSKPSQLTSGMNRPFFFAYLIFVDDILTQRMEICLIC